MKYLLSLLLFFSLPCFADTLRCRDVTYKGHLEGGAFESPYFSTENGQKIPIHEAYTSGCYLVIEKKGTDH